MDEWTAFTAVVATAVLGLAGIITTFLAPAWSQRKIEQRREARAFRRAQRRVAHELDYGADMLEIAEAAGVVPPLTALDRDFKTDAWIEEQGELGQAIDDDVWDAVRLAYSEFELAVATLRRTAQGCTSSGRLLWHVSSKRTLPFRPSVTGVLAGDAT